MKMKDESGAVAVLFSIIVGAGVLFGLLVVVADGGQLYSARRDSQDVADLVALSLAHDCIYNSTICLSSVTAKQRAVDTAQLNATGKKLFATVIDVCGSPLGGCQPRTVKYPCSDRTRNYIRVYTRESSASQEGQVPLFFSPLIQGTNSAQVTSCAQAAWGQVKAAPIKVPVIFSMCAFNQTNVVIREWKSSVGTVSPPCYSGPDFDSITHPGNFQGFFPIQRPATGDWFDTTCTNSVVVNVQAQYTREASDICRDGLSTVLGTMIGKATLVPISDTVVSGVATVTSFGHFVLLGFTVAGTPSPLNDPSINWSAVWDDWCLRSGASASGNKCLYGKFTPIMIPYQDIDFTVPNLGVNTVLSIP